MAPHSSTLAWKIPWMEEPGKPQSMGSRRVGHDWATSLYFTFWNMWDLVPWPGIEPVSSCIESMKSYSLECQESPSLWLLKNSCYIWETVPYLCIKSFHVCYDWILYTFTITYFTRHLGNFQSSAGWTKLQWLITYLGDAIHQRVCVSVGQILRIELPEQRVYVLHTPTFHDSSIITFNGHLGPHMCPGGDN